jgi:predicted kinase
LAGSGKSTLAESLAGALEIPIFSVDPIESSIIKSGIQKSFETGLAAYLVAESLAAEQLKLGISVIIDAVNPVKEARDMWRGLGKIYHARLIIIECVLNSELHQKRLKARVRNMPGMPEVTWENVENQRNEYSTWEENDRLVIDTSNGAEFNLNKALEYIH